MKNSPSLVNESRSKRQAGGLFISYSHHDSKWLGRIRTMLSPLIREDGVEVWDDTRIAPGSDWRAAIRLAIERSRVALLLVSPSFLASQFITGKELPHLLQAANERGLVVLWVLVSPCLYNKTAIAGYQAAHSISKPLDGLPLSRRNQELLMVAENVAVALQKKNRAARRVAFPTKPSRRA